MHEDLRSPATVLVVDDDPAIREVVTMALQDEGYEVVAALGADALAIASQRRPAAILLDIMMPQMGGVEMSQRLRTDPTTRTIPIIAMSATTVLAETAQAMQADLQLAKPFNLDDLFEVVAQAAGRA